MEQYTPIVLTIVSVLGSAGAWQFYQNKLKLKHQIVEADKKDQLLFRDDLRERVAILESKLEDTLTEKEKLLNNFAKLQAHCTEFRVKLEFLEKENERLKYK